jgi:hypothetical protein
MRRLIEPLEALRDAADYDDETDRLFLQDALANLYALRELG